MSRSNATSITDREVAPYLNRRTNALAVGAMYVQYFTFVAAFVIICSPFELPPLALGMLLFSVNVSIVVGALALQADEGARETQLHASAMEHSFRAAELSLTIYEISNDLAQAENALARAHTMLGVVLTEHDAVAAAASDSDDEDGSDGGDSGGAAPPRERAEGGGEVPLKGAKAMKALELALRWKSKARQVSSSADSALFPRSSWRIVRRAALQPPLHCWRPPPRSSTESGSAGASFPQAKRPIATEPRPTTPDRVGLKRGGETNE